MSKKVALLGPYPPPHGGVSIYVAALFESLRSRGLRLWTYGDRELNGERQNVSLIRNLFPVPYLEDDAALPSEIEEALDGLMRRERRVASVGVFIEEYGFLHTACAVELLRRETGADLGLVLLDGGFATDAAYRGEGLRGREWVTVLKNVAHPHVFTLFKRCDAFVRGTV